MGNIKFSYLYRDCGNYKNFRDVVFANPDNVGAMELGAFVRSKLIDGMWFYADRWLLPDLHFEVWDNETDHTWHEFVCVEPTDEKANSSITLNEFMVAVGT